MVSNEVELNIWDIACKVQSYPRHELGSPQSVHTLWAQLVCVICSGLFIKSRNLSLCPFSCPVPAPGPGLGRSGARCEAVRVRQVRTWLSWVSTPAPASCEQRAQCHQCHYTNYIMSDQSDEQVRLDKTCYYWASIRWWIISVSGNSKVIHHTKHRVPIITIWSE